MPSSFRSHPSAVGAAVGSSQLAAVQLTRSRYGLRVERAGLLSMQHDGLLTEQEFRQAAQEWLRERAFTGLPACGNLPQVDVNTVITEFPQTRSRQKLNRMVEYQTRQLCGLTDERFLSDYQALDGGDGDTIPIILAVGRASRVEERLQYLGDLGLRPEQLTATGMALYNAFRTLESGEVGGLQAVVDVAPEGLTVALLCRGRLSQLSALPLTDGASASSVGRLLAAEVPAMAARWRQEAHGGMAGATEDVGQLSAIWVTGGYGELSLAVEHVRRQVACEVRIFGVPASSCPQEGYCGPEADGVFPALTVAYGLAAQALGEAVIRIVILPELLVWQQRKMSLFPYFVTFYVLLVAALLFQAITFSYNIYHRREVLRQREAELNAIDELVPQIEAAYRDLEYQQLRLLPLVELSSRRGQFLRSIAAWQKLLPESDGKDRLQDGQWCVYLADNFSFDGYAEASSEASTEGGTSSRRAVASASASNVPEVATAPRRAETAEPAPMLLGGLDEAPAAAAPAQSDQLALPPRLPVARVPRLGAMYVGGFVVQDEASYLTLKRMQESLNETGLFANVDDHVDFITPAFMNRFLTPWEHFLVMNRAQLGRNYTLFFLKMPLRESVVEYMPEEEE